MYFTGDLLVGLIPAWSPFCPKYQHCADFSGQFLHFLQCSKPHCCFYIFSLTQESCLKNIGGDLRHYYRFLSTQPDPNSLLHTVVSSLQELMQVIYLPIYIFLCFNSWRCKTSHLFSTGMFHMGRWGGRREGKWRFIFIRTNCRYSEESCFQTKIISLFLKVAVNHQSSYDERMKLCKVLKGFQVRSITINRAMQYMNSGEDAQWTI